MPSGGKTYEAAIGSEDRWSTLESAERRQRIEQACREGDLETLWSLTEEYLERHRGSTDPVSEHTRRSYRRSIALLLDRWAGEATLQPSHEAAVRLLDEIKASGASPSTLKVHLAGMRALYRALAWAGVVTIDPFARVRAERAAVTSTDERQPYSREERELLLSLADPVDRVMILLLADAGLQVAEAVGLRWTDIDLAAGQLRVQRGGSHSGQATVLPRSVLGALRSLPSGRGDRVLGFTSEVRARQRMQRLCQRAGLPYRGLHALRRSSRESRAEHGTSHRGLVSMEPHSPEVNGSGQIPSLVAFKAEMERGLALADRMGIHCGLLLMEVEGFERIQTDLGVDFGEAALSAIGARIDRIRRRYDFVGQYAQGKFAVLLMNIPSEGVLQEVAQRFITTIASYPVGVRGKTVPVAVRVGATMGNKNPDSMLADADTALQRNRVQYADGSSAIAG